MHITHTWTDDTATIRVEGLTDTIRMLHLTDTHVALIDDRDADHVDACQRTVDLFKTIRTTDGGTEISSSATYNELMADAKETKPDMVALTGDIIHFPSQACLDHVMAPIEQLEMPVLYTAGNHDWHYPGVEGRAALREACWPLLEPLHKGNAAYNRYELKGLQWLCVDNSDYQVTEEQLSFVTTHLKNQMPTVILMHIPMSLATLRDDTFARWKAPILIADPDWDPESRDRWGTAEDLDSTKAFAGLLAGAENLVAVFCGHIHFPHVDTINPHAVQYVTTPGFEGGKRMVEFQPLG